MALETHSWDIQDHLDSPARIAGYLEAAFEDGDPALIAAALGDVARARGMSALAEASDLSRQALYKALSADGNPTLSTMTAVLKQLGLKLAAVPA